MSVRKTTRSSRPSQSPQIRLSACVKIVLRGRHLAKSATGTIVKTRRNYSARRPIARDIAQAERPYPPACRLPHAAQRWYDCMARLDFHSHLPTLMNADRGLQEPSACFVLTVEDSLDSVYDSLKHQALIHQSGSGTGFSLSRMLKKSTSGVLALLRGSTYRSVRSASSLAAALLDGIFEHPANCSCVNATRKNTTGFERQLSFSAAC